jgi:hypothetical protein
MDGMRGGGFDAGHHPPVTLNGLADNAHIDAAIRVTMSSQTPSPWRIL